MSLAADGQWRTRELINPSAEAPAQVMSALPWGKQPCPAVSASGELDVSIVHWGPRAASNANLFSPGKLPRDGDDLR